MIKGNKREARELMMKGIEKMSDVMLISGEARIIMKDEVR